jgi:predicted transcriptional regulator
VNTPDRALLLSLHPRFATAILNGDKTVELRRQRVAVPSGTPVILYATSPVMALTGAASLTHVDTADPGQIWRRHRTACGISRTEYRTYMDGASHASALLLRSPRQLSRPVSLDHLRSSGAFHPPQSYRYLSPQVLHQLVAGHEAADELLSWLTLPPAPADRVRHDPQQPSLASRPARRPASLPLAVMAAGSPSR